MCSLSPLGYWAYMKYNYKSPFNVLVISGSVSTDWFPSSLWAICSYFFACLIIFGSWASYCEFYPCNGWIFLLFLSILLRFFSWMHLSNLERVWSFEVLLVSFVMWDPRSVWFETNYCPLPRQYPSERSAWADRGYSWMRLQYTCLLLRSFTHEHVLIGIRPNTGG